MRICILLFFLLISFKTIHVYGKLSIVLGDNYGKHAMMINKKPAGIQKDLLDWFLKDYMKLDVKIMAMPWIRAQKMVEQTKKYDGYFTAYTEKRVKVLNLVPSKNPFYTTSAKMHTWKGNSQTQYLKKIKNINDLLKMKHIKHIYLRGSGYHEELLKNAKEKREVNSIELIKRILINERKADIFIEQSELFYPILEEDNLLNKVHTFDNVEFKKLKWHLYIRPDSEYIGIMKKINMALEKSSSDGTLLEKVRKIFTKYGLKYN